MHPTTDTPGDLTIKPRNAFFARSHAMQRWWCGGDPVATAFYNALSLTFPRGEAFFIDSVRFFRDAVPASQTAQIDQFTKQEAVHSREHSHFNRQVKAAGYDVALIDAELAQSLQEASTAAPIVNLAATVAYEHLTAIFAHEWLRGAVHFKGAPDDLARLWRWHSIEEIEHKAVAFDAFLALTERLTAYKRWKFRCLLLLNVSRSFIGGRLRHMGYLFAQDGLNKASTWLRVFYFLLIYPGLLRRVVPAWLRFFKPGFHPWQHDDRALLKSAESTLHLSPGPEVA